MKITKQTKFLTTEQFFELYNQLIKETGKGLRIKTDGKRIRASTIDNYIYIKKQLEEFVSETKYDLKLFLVLNLTAKEKEKATKY